MMMMMIMMKLMMMMKMIILILIIILAGGSIMKMTGPRKVPDIPIINQSRQSDVGDKHPYRMWPPLPVVDMNHALSHADTNCPLQL